MSTTDAFLRFVHNQVPEELAEPAARAWEQLARDPRHKQCNIELLAENFREAVINGMPLTSGNLDTMLADHVAAFEATPQYLRVPGAKELKMATPPKTAPDHNLAARPAAKTSFREYWGKLETPDRVMTATSLLVAGMSAFSAVGYLSQATTHDAEGKSQVQWSHVGMGVVMAALTAGVLYATHGQVVGAGRAAR